MESEREAEYAAFVKVAWENAVSHTKGRALPQERFLLITDAAGNKHTLFSQSVRHIYKQHGNEASERKRGQIAITERDILNLPNIIGGFSFLITNIKYMRKPSALYATHGIKNTFVYIEKTSTKGNHSSATFYNLDHKRNSDGIIKMLANNKLYDISGAKIIAGDGGGGNPSDTAMETQCGTAATSINPTDT